jgi:hypothetical protein
MAVACGDHQAAGAAHQVVESVVKLKPQGQMVVKLSPVVQCPKPMGFMICHCLVVVGYN